MHPLHLIFYQLRKKLCTMVKHGLKYRSDRYIMDIVSEWAAAKASRAEAACSEWRRQLHSFLFIRHSTSLLLCPLLRFAQLHWFGVGLRTSINRLYHPVQTDILILGAKHTDLDFLNDWEQHVYCFWISSFILCISSSQKNIKKHRTLLKLSVINNTWETKNKRKNYY